MLLLANSVVAWLLVKLRLVALGDEALTLAAALAAAPLVLAWALAPNPHRSVLLLVPIGLAIMRYANQGSAQATVAPTSPIYRQAAAFMLGAALLYVSLFYAYHLGGTTLHLPYADFQYYAKQSYLIAHTGGEATYALDQAFFNQPHTTLYQPYHFPELRLTAAIHLLSGLPCLLLFCCIAHPFWLAVLAAQGFVLLRGAGRPLWFCLVCATAMPALAMPMLKVFSTPLASVSDIGSHLSSYGLLYYYGPKLAVLLSLALPVAFASRRHWHAAARYSVFLPIASVTLLPLYSAFVAIACFALVATKTSAAKAFRFALAPAVIVAGIAGFYLANGFFTFQNAGSSPAAAGSFSLRMGLVQGISMFGNVASATLYLAIPLALLLLLTPKSSRPAISKVSVLLAIIAFALTLAQPFMYANMLAFSLFVPILWHWAKGHALRAGVVLALTAGTFGLSLVSAPDAFQLVLVPWYLAAMSGLVYGLVTLKAKPIATTLVVICWAAIGIVNFSTFHKKAAIATTQAHVQALNSWLQSQHQPNTRIATLDSLSSLSHVLNSTLGKEILLLHPNAIFTPASPELLNPKALPGHMQTYAKELPFTICASRLPHAEYPAVLSRFAKEATISYLITAPNTPPPPIPFRTRKHFTNFSIYALQK